MAKFDSEFTQRLVREILTGLREGLCRFSGRSRVAVIYQLQPDEELFVCDPNGLLRGHETRIATTFFDSTNHRDLRANHQDELPYHSIDRITSLRLDGIISSGGSSGPVFYQMWFTDHHPALLSKYPTERWLDHTVFRFSHDVANKRELYTGISGSYLREYAARAVEDQIRLEQSRLRRYLSCLEIYPILEAILGISRTREEKRAARGELAFVDAGLLDNLDFLARFDLQEPPLLENYKHVRKLLQAVQTFHNRLISDGRYILGIARGTIDVFHLSADFRGAFGFLKLNNQKICSFADGSYSSDGHQAKLFEVEEILLDYDLDSAIRSSLFHIVADLVHFAETGTFGCCLVLDLNKELLSIAGQDLEQPLFLERSNMLDLAGNLARVDGALQIGLDRNLHRFACLLDGESIAGENRARGARYNSALRFTAHHRNTICVVVSSDRPVSVITNGIEYSAACALRQTFQNSVLPVPLEKWLERANIV